MELKRCENQGNFFLWIIKVGGFSGYALCGLIH